MQAPIKLKEIIWEVCGRCENGCDYCGSKDVRGEPINKQNIIDIAAKIALFKPEAIDVSGGDPLLVDLETHDRVISILDGVVCKIIINPKSFRKSPRNVSMEGEPFYDILDKYNWIGLSVNDEEELDLAKNKFVNMPFMSKTTIISNFNLSNIFLFDLIKDFVKKHKSIWQIQYTMYHDNNQPSLYSEKNKFALKDLFEKINGTMDEGINVVLADNMTNGPCSAGMSSLGICYNGDVIPCLSMRSWKATSKEDRASIYLGNLLPNEKTFDGDEFDDIVKEEREIYEKNPLKYIWENRLNNYRFCEFFCCKDYCHNKSFERTAGVKTTLLPLEQPEKNVSPFEIPICPKDDTGNIIMYGIADKPTTTVYGVFPGNTFVYGVAPKITALYAVTNDTDGTGASTFTGTNINCSNKQSKQNKTPKKH